MLSPSGARFPGGRPSVTSFNVRTTDRTSTTTTTTTTLTSEAVGQEEEVVVAGADDTEPVNPASFSASISIPVYRPPNAAGDIQSPRAPEDAPPPPNNILNLDDIYKKSEMKQHNFASSDTVTAQPSNADHGSASQSVTEQNIFPLSTMSTEKSSSFSISVDERMVEGENIELDANKPRKVPSTSDGQKIEIKDLDGDSEDDKGAAIYRRKPIQIVTSAPFSELKPQSEISSGPVTTTPSSSQNTSTKIVKTVRVRQRMRPGGSGGGGFHGAIRNRFNGGGGNGSGRIRVVHRPVTPEYVKHFPEFATTHSDKLAKEEEEEVKNALIELKRSERTESRNKA
jgi:hypothetical protein